MDNGLVHDLLRDAAAREPAQTAAIDEARSLTYETLERRANGLAEVLVEHGVSPGDRVGIFMEKSLEALVAIYGILKAGAVYVPFDPQAPERRLAGIAQNAGVTRLVTRGEMAESWSQLRDEGAPVEVLIVLGAADVETFEHVRGVEVIHAEPLDEHDDPPSGSARRPDDLAYILYTSGSTGEPKGVMLSHRNARAFIDWSADEFDVRSTDRLSSHAPLHFDLSVFDLFASARGGATVVLVPRAAALFPVELARFMEATRISVWYSVPSALTMLVLRGDLAAVDLSALRVVLFAGEVFPTKFLERLVRLLPNARLANLFGPTETNVCTWYDVPHADLDPATTIPIGRPISGVQTLIVDDNGNEVRPGEVGELLVSGPTVMHGYWADQERTSRVLVHNAAGRTYRTGDLVREASDGNLLFLGRRDAQIKSRGYRIELGDVEAALNAHPGVLEAAVIAIPDKVFTNKLKAIVAVRTGVDEAELVHFSRERLPRYMVPDFFDLRTALPKSSTGKIDRKRLAEEPAVS